MPVLLLDIIINYYYLFCGPNRMVAAGTPRYKPYCSKLSNCAIVVSKNRSAITE